MQAGKPHLAPTQGVRQTEQRPKGKRLVWVSESIDQIIKYTITTNTKRQKTK